MEDSKNKNKIIGISIGILIVLLVVISSTYAYWQITRSQNDPNSIIAACLDFNVDFPVGISKDNAWPISDSEGMNLEGYTFTVTNNCDTDVNYVIGLESVTSDGISEYLSDESIALAFDNELLGTYDKLSNLQGPSTDARGSKELRTATLKGNSTNTHNLKLWIDEESDVSEQGKGFAAKLFITGGQEIENDNPAKQATADACFEMDGNEIIGYDESCGESVIIPATVNGVAVKTIDSNAFKGEGLSTVYYDDEIDNSGQTITPIENVDFSSANVMFIFDNYEENKGLDLSVENVIGNATYIVKLTPDAPVNATIDGAGEEYGISNKIKDSNNIPELSENQIAVYANLDADFDGPILGAKYAKTQKMLIIDSLDLSNTIYLETIEEVAFSNVVLTKQTVENCVYPILNTDLSYKTGLTSLNFGANNKEIKVELAAFAFSKFDNLEIYTTLVQNAENYYCSGVYGLDDGYLDTFGSFAGSEINNLKIKSTSDKKIMINDKSTTAITDNISIGTLTFDGDITEIGDFMFSSSEISNINFPNSLTTIGEKAFQYVTKPSNINIPYSVTNIGTSAFKSLPSTSTITMIGRKDLVGMTLGSKWNGSAEIVYP